MSFISDYLENKLIDHVFRNIPYNAPGTIYVALYSSDPGEDNSGTELTGSGYDRQAASMDVPVNGISYNSSDIVFPSATADWQTITHIGIMDASIGGNLLFYGALSSPVTVLSGNNFRLPAGNLALGFD